MLVLAVAAAGCASDDDAAPTAPTATTATTTTTAPPLEGLVDGPVVEPADSDQISLLERLALGQHEGFDRVVFQFRNDLPGYRIEYVEPPIREDGSGANVKVAGDAFLLVRMELASGFDLNTDEGVVVYTGPRRIVGSRVVREVVRTGDFEAVLSWVIGVESERQFRVLRLDDPARLVVDIPTG